MMRAIFASGLFLSLGLCAPASAILVAYEGFDYPNSSGVLHNRSGGVGWTTGWQDNDMDMSGSLSANDVSLTSPIFPFTPVGDHLAVPAGGGEAIRFFGNAFDMSVDGTTVYGSILMQKVGVGGTGSDAVEVRLITPTNNEGFRVGFASNEGFFIDSGVQQLNLGAGTLDIGQNYFFVFKAVSSADGPDQFFASAYGPSDPVPSTEPITWDLMLEEAVSHKFNGIRLDAGPNTEGALFDEIRIGETWADVAVGTTFLAGDFNGNSMIDPGDLSVLMANLYTGSHYSEGDIDFNGIVDLHDYNAFRTIYQNAGFVMPSSAQVPEPATLATLATLLVGLFAGRRLIGKASSALAVAVVVATVGLASHASAQTEYTWVPTSGEHDWNVDDNWLSDVGNFVPNADFVPGESAVIGANNPSVAVVSSNVPRIGQLLMDGGNVRIDSGGRLETFMSGGASGAVVLARPDARLEVQGNGHLAVGTVLSITGGLHVQGPAALVSVASDMLMNEGTLGANITAPTHSAVMVGGIADLSGTLEVNISGVTPSNGSSWNLVTATGGITRMFENVVIQNAPSLARGLQYRAAQSGNTARLEVGNTLILTVDRQTGMATIENAVGSAIGLASYAITSNSGSLLPAGLQSLNTSGVAGTGWTPGPQTTSVLAEQKHNSTFSLGAGQSVSLGTPYGLGVLPADEDVNFQFTTTDGRVLNGIVEYTGPVNDFTLYINPTNGQAAIGNLSAFTGEPQVTGYAILSGNNQLVPSNWNTFQSSPQAGSGWLPTPGSTAVLTETNIENSFKFDNGTLIPIGAIFTPNGNRQDLEFLYTVAGETEVRQGTVSFGPLPTPFEGLVGDYNDDNVVDARDYVVWRNNLGTNNPLPNDPIGGTVGAPQYAQWKASYGNTNSGALQLSPQAVPEPGTTVVLIGGAIGLLFLKRHGRHAAHN